MKTVIVYKSKSGYSKKYAEWIATELNADLFEASKVSVKLLSEYDRILYAAGLYAVGINGIKLIKGNLNTLKERQLIVLAIGATPARQDTVDAIEKSNFTQEELRFVKVFYLRGGFDYSKLTFVDKILMKMLKLKLKIRKSPTPDEKGMLAAYSHPVDFTRKDHIREVIDYIKGDPIKQIWE